MSNLRGAQKKPSFGWYHTWLKLSHIGKPQQYINAGMRQPDRIKVSWDQPDINWAGGTCALFVSVVPDQNLFGAKCSLIYAINEFKKKIKCLQGAAATK
eukprot:5265234-Ditylum_brightwellii.AAC.1